MSTCVGVSMCEHVCACVRVGVWGHAAQGVCWDPRGAWRPPLGCLTPCFAICYLHILL